MTATKKDRSDISPKRLEKFLTGVVNLHSHSVNEFVRRFHDFGPFDELLDAALTNQDDSSHDESMEQDDVEFAVWFRLAVLLQRVWVENDASIREWTWAVLRVNMARARNKLYTNLSLFDRRMELL